ncbi:tetratricopeptide (TPR) repeat protein [Chryseobacterium bernardetii]|uniref:Tetratricopeptide repeat protein n=3 Tax=Chryseobacterium group TaxID=2782232 RepID=A0A543EMG7_9FLAO|nr:tetratricopeptide repeat protein [Chryseobacterium aquifrigidense]MDR6369147.1 tetratricopeptide (TPR) repeat protein [Chryseobacterium vietnamense]MDR6439930.1 tetratricopeptide (TPR) repeat protein [Chryseobacterium bernardetii]TQM22752.1 tetratricopeptide repeat protein [Chryseobacterium aquifrigidense]
MFRQTYFIAALTAFSFIYSQKKTFKCTEVHDAVKLIDDGKYDEGIAILRECEKKDPKDYTYPYEIALAYIRKEDYKSAISLLEKIKDYPNIDDYYYALLGNAYDYDDNPEQAIKAYDEGLKKFPSSGKLYLEKGVVLELQKKINQAIESYEKGIKAEPSYSSNYYRIAKLFLNSNNMLYGLIYGEIFLNLERTTSRSQEMSQLLYNGYKKAIKFKEKSTTVDLCQAIIIIEKDSKPNDTLPFCILYSGYFAFATVNKKEINLETLSDIRKKVLKEYFKSKSNPSNVLLNYQKIMDDNNLFNAYNYYLFQIGDKEAFKNWLTNNKEEYEKFVDWYTNDANILKINEKNLYIPDPLPK